MCVSGRCEGTEGCLSCCIKSCARLAVVAFATAEYILCTLVLLESKVDNSQAVGTGQPDQLTTPVPSLLWRKSNV